MLKSNPDLLALDFDGVVCDGLIEYFQTAWRAYCEIWSPEDRVPPEGVAEQFYRLRPVVETGWEMPVLVRSILLGIPEEELLLNWVAIAQRCITEDQLAPAELSTQVDGIRDEWIATDLDNWLAQHRFYPGVIDRLQKMLASPTQVFIITTKEGRFVHQLLRQQGIELKDSQVFGKEVRQPKAMTLRALIQEFDQKSDSPLAVWFVEDRLKTLRSVEAQADLEAVQLFLADWGYNTPTEKESVKVGDRIKRLSLDQFAEDFSAWNA